MKNGQERYDVELGIREWKHYPEHKNSGVEWIGKIPEHWRVMPIGQAVKKITNGFVGPTRDIFVNKGVRYLQSLHIKNGKIKFDQPYYVTEEWSKHHQKSILKEDDVLVVQTGSIGQCCAVPKEFEDSNCHALIILKLQEGYGYGSYLSFLLQSNYGFNSLLRVQTGALHPHLDCGKVKEIPILLPPPIEQEQIISFLNRETSKIDILIEKKQRFIELLEEKRSALINRAVTKGLDPDVKMKDSGVEWIGEIPENWKISQLKFCYDVQLGKMLQNEPSSANDTLEPYLRAANVNWNGVDITDIKEMWFGFQEKQKYILEIGDLLVSEGGDAGRSAIWQGELPNCYIQNAINRVRAKKGFSTKFLFYWMCSIKHSGLIDIICDKATIAHLTAEKLERILVPIISENEQQLIVNFLDFETEKIDILINKISEQIEKLKEYRTALISAAVTGKIDVREEVA